MFKCPLFVSKYMKKELIAVNNEHEANKTDQGKILYHSMRLASERHPFHRFCTGSSATLKHPKQVKLYFAANFGSDKISIVILGPQSLNHLQRLVLGEFESLTDELRKVSSLPNILRESYAASEVFPTKCKLVHVVSSQYKTIRLYFPIYGQSNIELYLSVWCNIIGDESKHSLVDHLLSNGYISSLLVSSENLAIDNTALMIDIELTNFGTKHLEELVLIVGRCINGLSGLGIDYIIAYMKDISTVNELNYLYKDTFDITELAQNLQLDLNDLGIENLMKGYREETPSSEKFFYLTEKYLSWNNLLVSVLGDTTIDLSFIVSSSIDKEDPHYNFTYNLHQINLLRIYKKILSHHYTPIYPKLTHLKSPQKFTSNQPTYLYPQIIRSSAASEIWFKEESSSHKSVSFQFTSSLQPTAVNITGVELLCGLLSTNLRKILYSTELIGYNWAIFPNRVGLPAINIFLSGLSKDFSEVLQQLIDYVKEFISTEVSLLKYEDFKKARIKYRHHLHDLVGGNSLRQSALCSLLFLEEGVFDIDERIDALDQIDLSDMVEISKRLYGYVEILITGGSLKSAKCVGKVIERLFIPSKVSASSRTSRTSSKTSRNSSKLLHDTASNISGESGSSAMCSTPDVFSSYILPKAHFSYVFTNTNKNDPLNAVFYYIQIGLRDNAFLRVMSKFVSYYLSLSCSFELRTTKQLGYVVLNSSKVNRETLGTYILVMSADYTSTQLTTEIDDYLNERLQKVSELTEAEFQENTLQPFLKSFKGNEEETIPSNLVYSMTASESSTNFSLLSEIYKSHNNLWEQVLMKNYRFNGVNGNDEIDLTLIKDLTKAKFSSFFESFLKSSLSIGIDAKQEVRREMMKKAVRGNLEEKGLFITNVDLLIVLESCDYDMGRLHKKLFSYYKAHNMGMKFLAANLKEIGLGFLMRRKLMEIGVGKKRVMLSSVGDFHSKCEKCSKSA